jgi:hypothetical protein
MSFVLPNGSTIGVTTLEGLEEIGRHLREGTPIVVTSVGLDGTQTETVLWHPDDPVVYHVPLGYVPPGGEPVYETILAFPIRLWRWAFMGQNIRGRFYRPPPVEPPTL